jgi:hypothetical protein
MTIDRSNAGEYQHSHCPVLIENDSSVDTCKSLRHRRKSFLVFVRILLKCIDRADDKILSAKVRKLVICCVRRFRSGEQTHGESLMDNVESRLKLLVGSVYWKEARAFLKHYHEWKQEDGPFCASCGPTARTQTQLAAV